MVTEAEANSLLEEEKVVWANLNWIQEGVFLRLEAKVLCLETEAVLKLHGFIGRTNRSYVLLYQNTPIRKYTVHAYHKDPVTGERVTEPHKHFWDDVWEDKRVYIPDDIRVGNPDEELRDFLKECNINLRGHYFQGLLE